ncbi:MAG: twin-arginine translocase TatA/TatE family subunit [Patescibacteria group bacterium]
MLQNIGTFEIVVIALVILMLFGAKKLPEFAKGLVDSKKEFKKSFEDKSQKKDKSDKSA